MEVTYTRHIDTNKNNRVEFLLINYDYMDGNDYLAKLFAKKYGFIAEEKIDGWWYSIIRLHLNGCIYELLWHEDTGNAIYCLNQTEEENQILQQRLEGVLSILNAQMKEHQKERICMNKEFEKWLQDNEWQVEVHLSGFDCSESDVLKRFRNIPDSFLGFLEYFKSITSKDDTTWFLCGGDYNDDSEDAFKWNEYELMSLEAAENDSDWKKEIEKWWSDKLPFLMSVKDGYSFYAIDLGENKGAIIKGEEPEFEETYVIADSFEDFLEKIMNNTIIL